MEVTGHQLPHPGEVLPDLEFLRDEKLNRSMTFKDLRGQVERHFQKSQAMHPDKSRQWKHVLYTSLLTSLREVAFTADEEEQRKMLKQVHQWYRSKTNRPSIASARMIPKQTAVAFNSSFSFLDKTRKAQTVKAIEVRSLSPAKATRAPMPAPATTSVKLSKPFVDTAPLTSFDETVLMQRVLEYQQRKLKELRAAVLEKKEVAAWGKYRSRHEETAAFSSEQRSFREPRKAVDELLSPKRQTPSPLLIDFRNDTRSVTPTSTTADSIVDRVSRLRQNHAELLNVPVESPARRSPAVSLSCYCREPVGNDTRRPQTPSAYAGLNAGKGGKSEQGPSFSPRRRLKIEELLEVKRKLALANLPCTYRVLTNGLLEPEDLPSSHLTPQSLPQGGELMMSNPFFATKKKKKLKKKK